MDFENDPAADFINREREELAGIMNDDEGELSLVIFRWNQLFLSRMLQSHFMNHRSDPALMSNEDFELINSEIQQADANTEDLADDLAGMSFNSSIPQETEKVVPEKIRLWREEMQQKLEEKDRMEVEAKEALRVSAEKEMTEWKSKMNETMTKTKSLNRNNEKEFEATATNEDAKNMWESITSLCDFSTKGPKNAKDASRMRSIFLQMKSAPKVN